MKIIFTNEELAEIKIEKQNYIMKEIVENYTLKEIEEDIFIFICQPIHDILSLIIQLSVLFQYTEFNIIFIPGETYEITDFLIYNDLDYRFNIYNYNIDIIPIDNDLLSLEKENNFRKIYLEKDLSSINDLANNLIKLEACFGKVRHKYIKGSKAKLFNELLIKKEVESNLKDKEEVFGMIVFDRSIDFITPLLTNYTYEGLIDEYYGIDKGNIIIDESYFREKKKIGNEVDKRILYSLASNSNEFFSKVRCMNFLDAHKYLIEVRKFFSEKAKETKTDNEKVDFIKVQKTIEDINTFISLYRSPILINTKFMDKIFNENIKGENIIYREKESIFLCGNIPKNIEIYYSDYMSEKKNLLNILNLMCIHSLTQGGIKDYYSLKRDILNIYGYQNIFLLRDLESMELLKPKINIKKQELTYEQISGKLDLINPNFSKEKITDCSYIFQGYCPITLRLIELVLEGKWNKMKETINKMPGETIFPSNEKEILQQNQKIKTIFVVFIGGVTYTEIEGIRYLNIKLKNSFENSKNNLNSKIQLIIVTDEILNKKKIFNNLGKNFEQKFSYKKCYNEMQRISKKE